MLQADKCCFRLVSIVTNKGNTDMEVITITHSYQGETTVKVARETAKAVLLVGNASEAWFPKKAISDDNCVADWFSLSIEHCFLWQAPYTEAA